MFFDIKAPTILILTAGIAAAEDRLLETITPGSPPYPWKILNVSPGVTADNARSILESEFDGTLVPEDVTLRVQSSNGNAFDHSYTRRLLTQGIGIHQRMGSDPYEDISLALGTEAIGNRVLSIRRTIRDLNSALPEAAALKSQLEEAYGKASRADITAHNMTLTYAWGGNGFINDLDAEPVKTMEYTDGRGRTNTFSFQTCESGKMSTVYEFDQVRREPIAPGCVAIFTIQYKPGAETSEIIFTLSDFEMVRDHVESVDQQILDSLTRETPPSDGAALKL